MDAEDFTLYDGANTQVVEYFSAVFPWVRVSVLSDSLIEESINCRNLSGFVVSSEQGDVSRIFKFQAEQELEGLN